MRKVHAWEISTYTCYPKQDDHIQIFSSNCLVAGAIASDSLFLYHASGGWWQVQHHARGCGGLLERVSFWCGGYVLWDVSTYVDESELVLCFGLCAGAATSEEVLIEEIALPEEAVPEEAVVVTLLCRRGGVDAVVSGIEQVREVKLPEKAVIVILV